MEPYVVTADQVVRIYNGIPFERLVQGVEACEPFAPGRQWAIGMVGQLVGWKKHALFIEAACTVAREFPDVLFFIVGDSLFEDNTAYELGLRRQVEERKMGDRVVFTGHRRSIGSVLGGMDMRVHQATAEPFGRVVVEAMALGRPVVAANAAGPAELLRDGESGLLVPPNDAEALAAGILRLMRNPAEARVLGEQARHRAYELFSHERFVASCVEVYEEVRRTHADRG
jgi:glycosyltransferase involved in cell wall biosynthesis